MPEPSEKSPEMTKAIDDLTEKFFGKSRSDSIREAVCVSCKNPATQFRDEISRKEFTISGLCQTCQDQIFGED